MSTPASGIRIEEVDSSIKAYVPVSALKDPVYLVLVMEYLDKVGEWLQAKAVFAYSGIAGAGKAIIEYYDAEELLKASENYLNTFKYKGIEAWQAFSNYTGNSAVPMYYGFAGLLTGGIVGIYIGYSFSSSWISKWSYEINSVLSTNPKMGIDGLTTYSIPAPSITHPNQVVILVKAAGIDHIDAKIACGYSLALRKYMGLGTRGLNELLVMGKECSGIVIETGHEVQNFEVNQKVWVNVPLWRKNGVMAEYIVVPENYVAHAPANIPIESAATLPYAASVFWKTIVKKTSLNSRTSRNKRILLYLNLSTKNDGVCLLATQVFKVWGAKVTIALEANDSNGDPLFEDDLARSFLHELRAVGVENCVVIPKDHLQALNAGLRSVFMLSGDTTENFDAVINTSRSQMTPVLQSFCKDEGDKVVETFPLEENQIKRGSIFSSILALVFFPLKMLRFQKPDEERFSETMQECKEMVESGRISPIVAKSFIPSQYDTAFRYVFSENPSAITGKVGKSVIVFQ